MEIWLESSVKIEKKKSFFKVGSKKPGETQKNKAFTENFKISSFLLNEKNKRETISDELITQFIESYL